MPNKEQAQEWFNKAEEDRAVAEALLKDEVSANAVCFHSQQIAEKYLKGFLVFKESDFEKTHTLERLLESCAKINPEFLKLKEEAASLSAFYVETRYPGDFPQFTFTDARKALDSAKKIKEFVLEKLTN